MSDMDFTRIKNLIRGNGEKLILMENGEPEAVVMSFSEYARLNGVGTVSAGAVAAPAGAVAAPMRHATEERLDMPSLPHEPASHDEWHGVDTGEETKLVLDEWPRSPTHDPPIRLADIRLEDLPI